MIYVAIGKDTRGQNFEFKPFSDFLITHNQDPRCADPVAGDLISAPHSNSFLDLDGDCMPDIFLQKQRIKFNTPLPSSYENYFEIYVQKLYNGKQKFCLM